MPLQNGTRLGPYEVVSPLGAGVSADGQRFLVNTDVGEIASSPLNLVLNWGTDAKR
jgi:hypothetical protein